MKNKEDKAKVILLKDYSWLWKKGEIKEVSHSYASNFLIPKNIANFFTKDIENSLNQKQIKQEKKKNELTEIHNRIKDTLIDCSLLFEITKDWKIYSSVWKNDILKELSYVLWEDSKFLDKSHIDLNKNIKELWTKQIEIKLSKNIKFFIFLEII